VATWLVAQAVAAEREKHERVRAAMQTQIDELAGISESLPIEEARRRKLAAEARLAELELARQGRRLADVDLVVAEVARDYGNVRARVLQIAARATPRLIALDTHATVFEALHEEVCMALADISADGACAAVDRALDRDEARP